MNFNTDNVVLSDYVEPEETKTTTTNFLSFLRALYETLQTSPEEMITFASRMELTLFTHTQEAGLFSLTISPFYFDPQGSE